MKFVNPIRQTNGNAFCCDYIEDENGKKIIRPTAEWDCSPMRPETLGIVIEDKTLAMLEAMPDLLDALHRIKDATGDGALWSQDRLDDTVAEIREIANSAISKAEGRS